MDEEEEEEILSAFELIDQLQDFGVNAADINKLKDAGYATIGQLFQVAHKHLLQVKGISEAKLDKVSVRSIYLYLYQMWRQILNKHKYDHRFSKRVEKFLH